MGAKLSTVLDEVPDALVPRPVRDALRARVPEALCQPRYRSARLDYAKLRKLIKKRKLAPCHPGRDQDVQAGDTEVDECPICLLAYPSLNRTTCCRKQLCTECFVQVQCIASPPGKASCPFCKAHPMSVKFLGARSREEREREWMDEQLAAEAELRHQRRRDEAAAAAAVAGEAPSLAASSEGFGFGFGNGSGAASGSGSGSLGGSACSLSASASSLASSSPGAAAAAAGYAPDLLLELGGAAGVEELNRLMLEHAITASLSQQRCDGPRGGGGFGGVDGGAPAWRQSQQQLAGPVQVPA